MTRLFVAIYKGSEREKFRHYYEMGKDTANYFFQNGFESSRTASGMMHIGLEGKIKLQVVFDRSPTNFSELHEIEAEGNLEDVEPHRKALEKIYGSHGFTIS